MILEGNPELTPATAEELLKHFVSEGKLTEFPPGRRIHYRYYREDIDKWIEVDFVTKEEYYYPTGLPIGAEVSYTLTRKLVGFMYYVKEEVRRTTPTPFAFLICYVYTFQPYDYPTRTLWAIVDDLERHFFSLIEAQKPHWEDYHPKSRARQTGIAPPVIRRRVEEEREVDYPDDIVEMKAVGTDITEGTKRVGLDEIRRYILIYSKTGGIKLEMNEEAIKKRGW